MLKIFITSLICTLMLFCTNVSAADFQAGDTAYVKAGIGYKTVLVVNIGENGFFIGKLAVFVNNGEKHFILVLMLEGTHNIFKAHTVDNVFRVLHGEVF